MDCSEDLNLRLHSLVIFHGLLQDRTLEKLLAVLSCEGSKIDKLTSYTDFVSELFSGNDNLTDFIWDRISSNENLYVMKCAAGEGAEPVLAQCLDNELKILGELSQLSAAEVKKAIGFDGWLPEWKTRPADFVSDYKKMIKQISVNGYGIFSRYQMFSYKLGELVPVKYPDPISLSDLKGYERERKTVVDNTEALLCEKPAANVLLYGDAGTGKSSTVKAIVNEYANQGLRLIEIRKDQLLEIPAVIEGLFMNPLKFILFIDDLSYTGYSEEIGALKAILEGTVSAKAPNVVIYATSNRRHLINEKFSDRGNDDIHLNETIQEQISLSERFGLAVNFGKPDKSQYLEIIHELALQYGVEDIDDIDMRAERFALERGGRSPRVARQFVDHLKSMEK